MAAQAPSRESLENTVSAVQGRVTGDMQEQYRPGAELRRFDKHAHELYRSPTSGYQDAEALQQLVVTQSASLSVPSLASPEHQMVY